MYTISEVADMVGRSYHSTYRLVQSGEIRAVKIGGHYRIAKEEVAYIKEHGTRKPEAEK